jgi:arylsulfatase A
VVVEAKLANKPVPKYQLFDLSNDPAEKHNVIEDYPDVAEKLISRLDEIITSGRTRN